MNISEKRNQPQEINYDRAKYLKSFDDTKSGVKGLVDAGISHVTLIFHHLVADFNKTLTSTNNDKFPIFPIIYLDGIHKDDLPFHGEIVKKVGEAAAECDFFQVINHGIPESILKEMLEGTERFYEKDHEVKEQRYAGDMGKTFIYNTNFDLFSAPATNWRDTFYCTMAPLSPHLEELPIVCRDIIFEYSKQVKELGDKLFRLLSEALGFDRNHLKEMGCADGLAILGHYYPPCPQPELTMGVTKHADTEFLTVLHNDEVEGLQVLHENQWINVPTTPGALVINIDDLLHLAPSLGRFYII